MTRVYVPDVQPDARQVEVIGDEAHHLARVVRVRLGEPVGVFDGRGHEWRAQVSAVGRQTVLLDVVTAVTPVPEPAVRVTLAAGLLKGDQMDTVVRDGTVLGAAAIVPVASDHVVVPSRAWHQDGAYARRHRVAVAAAKQCGRAVVPEIGTVRTLAEVIQARLPGAPILACVEPGAPPLTAAQRWRDLPPPATALLLIGPEGGWSEAELATLAAAGAQALSLGPRTLRAESAPAVALTMIWSAWGWV